MIKTKRATSKWLTRSLGLTAASALALISACGGGGSISIDVQGNSTPTSTPINTNTPVPTATNTNTPVPTATNTNTPVPTATNTNTPVPTATNTATVSPTPAATAPPTQTPTPQPYAVTHSFGARNDGYGPTAGLISDGMGNFYGTTYSGGRALSGTVYKMTGAGVVSVVYPLNLSNPGANPEHSLVSDGAGNFYGSTKYAGSVPYGGSIFKITDAGSVTLLHTFSVSDGPFSAGPLLGDGAGNFYGTTNGGGANQKGTVFKITAAGAFTSLHSFEGADGNLPSSGLVTDGLGNFYGTTFAGGAKNQGAVYKITDAGVVTVLHSFSYDTPTNGSQPEGRLLRDDLGNFYGISSNGGANNTGTAYKISSTGDFTLLHSFGADGDGLYPKASLVSDGAGNIYGTTSKGGANNEGTVFKMTEAGVVTILHSFGSGLDGKVPLAELVFDGAGSLYGTTSEGGVFGKGTVFRIPAQ